jgi:hypothetical protein
MVLVFQVGFDYICTVRTRVRTLVLVREYVL